MQKIFTHTKIEIGKSFNFYGDPDDLLGLGDCIDLWTEKTRNGLGTEMVYGWAKVERVISKNYYVAIRMLNVY